MSRTFTSRPSVAGVQRGGQANPANRRPINEGRPTEQTALHRPGIDERTRRRDAYTVIAPDAEKRRSLEKQAKAEEQKMQQFKEKNRVSYVSYVGTVGGSQPVDAAEPSGSQQVKQSGGASGMVGNTKLPPGQKARQYREDEKRRQDAELDKMKEEQRRKAISNEDREKQRKAKLDEDRKKKMDAFLNQMTHASKHSTVSRQAAAAVAADAQQLHLASYASTDDADAAEIETTNELCDSDDLDRLMELFPDFSRSVLAELLAEADGNLADLIEVLRAD